MKILISPMFIPRWLVGWLVGFRIRISIGVPVVNLKISVYNLYHFLLRDFVQRDVWISFNLQSPFDRLRLQMTDVLGDEGILKEVVQPGVGPPIPNNASVLSTALFIWPWRCSSSRKLFCSAKLTSYFVLHKYITLVSWSMQTSLLKPTLTSSSHVWWS